MVAHTFRHGVHLRCHESDERPVNRQSRRSSISGSKLPTAKLDAGELDEGSPRAATYEQQGCQLSAWLVACH